MVSEFVKRQKSDFFRDFTALGSLWFYLIAILIFLIIKNYSIFIKLLIGLLLIYAVVIFIRTFYFKNRPKRYSYDSYIEKLDASSFPSLHSARAAFLSMILMNLFGNIIFSIFIVVLIGIVAYSRIYLKKHDLKDVLAGIILGVVVYFIVNLKNKGVYFAY